MLKYKKQQKCNKQNSELDLQKTTNKNDKNTNNTNVIVSFKDVVNSKTITNSNHILSDGMIELSYDNKRNLQTKLSNSLIKNNQNYMYNNNNLTTKMDEIIDKMQLQWEKYEMYYNLIHNSDIAYNNMFRPDYLYTTFYDDLDNPNDSNINNNINNDFIDDFIDDSRILTKCDKSSANKIYDL